MPPLACGAAHGEKLNLVANVIAVAWYALHLWARLGPGNIHLSVEKVGGWAQKSEGKPARMTLRWLEAENGNASEDSIKIKT